MREAFFRTFRNVRNRYRWFPLLDDTFCLIEEKLCFRISEIKTKGRMHNAEKKKIKTKGRMHNTNSI